MKVSWENPPRFTFTGNGRLSRCRITGPKVRDAIGEDQFVVWQIEIDDGSWGKIVEDLDPIVYGQVPKGYKQIYPEKGSAPPLVEGEIYYIRVDTNNANRASKYFTLNNGKIIYADYPYELEAK